MAFFPVSENCIEAITSEEGSIPESVNLDDYRGQYKCGWLHASRSNYQGSHPFYGEHGIFFAFNHGQIAISKSGTVKFRYLSPSTNKWGAWS